MSIKTIENKAGKRYRVKYREGGKQRYETFDRYNDAVAFKARLNQEKGLYSGDTLTAFQQEWWHACCSGVIQDTTAYIYDSVWRLHIKPTLGDCTLRELAENPRLIDMWAADMRANEVGVHAQRKAINVLSSMLTVAVRWRKIPSNPVVGVRKPSGKRRHDVSVLSPLQIEQLASHLPTQDALLVRLLAHCGLRPGEALALRGEDVSASSIRVDKAVQMRMLRVSNTKTHKQRAVRLSPTLRGLLGELHDGPLFPSVRGDATWGLSEWACWAKRIRRVAAEQGVPLTRLYDLRHSFVSLLIRSGKSVVEVAAQAGHTPAVCLETYAHVFAESENEPKRDVEKLLADAIRKTSRVPQAVKDANAMQLSKSSRHRSSGHEAVTNMLVSTL